MTTTGTTGDERKPEVPTRPPDAVTLQLARARAENRQLLDAMRHRSVIEQAKGVLMGWLGVGADEAFGVLVGYSQRTNRKLVSAAVALLAFAAERGPTGPDLQLPSDLRLFAELARTRLHEHLGRAALDASADLEGLLREAREVAGSPRPDAALLAVIEADGAVRIITATGYEPATIAGWERIPPNSSVPLSHTAATGAPVFTVSKADRHARFPGTSQIPGRTEAAVSLPIEVGGVRLGILAFSWETELPLDVEHRARLLEVADRCGRPLAEHLEARGALPGVLPAMPALLSEPGRARWFHATLDELPASIALLEPELADDVLVDLRIVHHNAEATERLELPERPFGRTISEVAPWLVDTPLWPLLERTAVDGAARRLAWLDLGDGGTEPAARRLEDIRITRVGSTLVVGWRDVLAATAPRRRP
jgi:hypothetical protein